jgi:hypothetical protein
MVEKAIEAYLKGGGTSPFGVICGGGIEAHFPQGVVAVSLPTLVSGAIGVVPLQTLIDLAAKTLWITEDDDDE